MKKKNLIHLFSKFFNFYGKILAVTRVLPFSSLFTFNHLGINNFININKNIGLPYLRTRTSYWLPTLFEQEANV